MADLLRWVVDLVTYFANGVLATVYFLLERSPHLISIAMALLIGLTFDRLVQRQATFAPRRYETGAVAPSRTPRTAQVMTLFACGLWLVATWTFGSLVPFIGALMWAAAFAGLLIMPQQRWSLLWSTKAYLIIYSLAVVGFRAYLWQAGQLSPQQLAEVFGGASSASHIIAQNTGTFASVGSWLLWAIMPAGFFALLLQNWMAQPMALVGPFEGAQDVMRALRTRGNVDPLPGSDQQYE